MTIDIVKDEFVWPQKYRPQKLDDVILPEAIKAALKQYVDEDKQIPNLLFFSPSPGTGKTTAALALCNELGVKPLFINGALQNSINDVRTLITDYATTVSLTGSSKIVVIDEFDRFSAAAQDSLKALIEEVSRNCRFILTSNSKAKIIEPLRSRMQEIDFVFSEAEQKSVIARMYKRAAEILTLEGVAFTPKVLGALVQRFSPDNRKLLQILQQYGKEKGEINEGVLAQVNTFDIDTLANALQGKDFKTVLQWCRDNQDGMNDDFYLRLYNALNPMLEQQSIPEAILILGEEQKYHTIVPDLYLHGAQLCTKLMMQLTFKGK